MVKRAMLIAEKSSVKNAIQAYITKYGYQDKIDCFAASGHLIQMCEPNEYCDEWSGKWTYDVLPMIPDNLNFKFKVVESTKEKFLEIKKALVNNGYDYIINACDSDREGEAIFWYIYNKTNCKLPVKRYWENDLTDASIKHALNTLRSYGDNQLPNLENLRTAAYLRGEFDWLVGMNFSRAASLSMNAVVKLGRVKTPVLWILVDLENRMKNFKKEYSYRIQANHEYGNEIYEFKNVELNPVDKTTTLITFDDKAKAEAILKNLEKNKSGKIQLNETKIKKTKPSKLYTLGDIQVEAASLYGMSIADSSAAMQTLYEKKITTYPRTKNPYLSSTAAANMELMIEACTCMKEVSNFADEILKDKTKIASIKKNPRYINDKVTAQEGHCAIVPTGQRFDENKLTDNEKKVLSMVIKRFLSIFMPDLREEETTILLESSGELFKYNVRNTVDLGFKVLYNEQVKKMIVPAYKVGDNILINEFVLKEVESKPPKRMNDGALISAMRSPAKYLKDSNVEMGKILKETDGIGTEATRKEIIPQLVKDGYIEIKGKGNLIYPTELGMKIIENLGDMDITAVDLTAKWETMLGQIKDGDLSEIEFKNKMLDYINSNIDEFKNTKFNSLSQRKGSLDVIGICPCCGGKVYSSAKAYFCENYAKDKSCGVVLAKVIKGAKISDANMKKILSGKPSNKISITIEQNGTKKKIDSVLIYDDASKKIVFQKKKHDAIGVCPCCGNEMIDNGKYVYCSNFGKEEGKCKVIFYRDSFSKDIDQEKINELYNKKTNISDFGPCPCCDGIIKGLYSGKFGDYYKCSNGCGFAMSLNQGGYNLTKEDVELLLSGEQTKKIKMISKAGKQYEASLVLDKDSKKITRIF